MKIRSTTTSAMRRATINVSASRLLLLVAGMSATTVGASAATTWYVRADAPSNGDGLSWATAYRDLNTALSSAAVHDTIWVARGTYRPGTSGNRAASFVMREGVDVYGGFAGTETSLLERNIAANPTILSGDLAGNDAPGYVNYGENAYHVVRATAVQLLPRLDGFTIRGGYANGNIGTGDEHGAGILASDADFVIANCQIVDNWASGAGGGVYLRQRSNATIEASAFTSNWGGGLGLVETSSANVVSTTFTSNYDQQGGAVRAFNSSVEFADCNIRTNSADQYGGGIYAFESDLALVRTAVSGNRVTAASASGGGINLYDTVAMIDGSNIFENTATGDGGGLAIWHFSEATLTNSKVYRNSSSDDGGGFAVWDGGSLTMTDREVSDNSANDLGGGLYVDQGATALLDDVDIARNTANRGGGAHVDGAVLTLANSWFAGNSARDTGGAMNVEDGGSIISRDGNVTSNSAMLGGGIAAHPGTTIDLSGVRLSANQATADGGAIYALECTPILVNNRLWVNRALNGVGGAIAYVRAQGIVMQGNAFSRNTAVAGGAIAAESVNLRMFHCTLSGNDGTSQANGVLLDSAAAPGRLEIHNSILRDGGDEVVNLDGSEVKATFSIIEGGEIAGLGVTNAAPEFVDPVTHNLMLEHGSAGIDAADNTAIPDGLETDVIGNPRKVDDEATGDAGRGRRPLADMGAYETPTDPLGNQFMVSVYPNPMQTRDPQAIFVDFGRPREQVMLAYSSRLGATYVSQMNVFLDLNNPKQLSQPERTDEEGTAVWVLDLPGGYAGRTLYLQAFQNGMKTNALEVEIVR